MGTSGDHQGAHSLSDREVECRLVELHVSDAVRAAERYHLLTEAGRRGIGRAHGYSSVAQWYSKNVRSTEGSIQHVVDVGVWVSTQPEVAAALAASEIHVEHVRALFDAHRNISLADPALDDGVLGALIAELLDLATHSTAGGVTHRARVLVAQVGADARARHDEERRRREEAERRRREEDEERRRREDQEWLRRNPFAATPPPTTAKPEPRPDLAPGPRPPLASENAALNTLRIVDLADGRKNVVANVDALTAAKLRTALDPLTKPHPEPDGTPDQRPASKRAADGLGIIIDQHLHRRPGAGGGSSARVNLVVQLKDLAAARCGHPSNPGIPGEALEWPFELEWAGPVGRSIAEMITCDASFNVVIVDGAGVPLSMGREKRLATDEQRIAVKVRDRCCVMCGRPASWCEVHHIVFWENGGETDLNNLALLCGRCHRLVHHAGWQLLMGEDGHPYSIPPAVTDPDRTPIPSYRRRRKPHA